MLRVGQRVEFNDNGSIIGCGVVLEITGHPSRHDDRPMVKVMMDGDTVPVLFSQQFLEPAEERKEDW